VFCECPALRSVGFVLALTHVSKALHTSASIGNWKFDIAYFATAPAPGLKIIHICQVDLQFWLRHGCCCDGISVRSSESED
jgi:hypothetical protein